MPDDPKDPTIDALIGHRGADETTPHKGEDFAREIYGRLTPEQREMVRDEGTGDPIQELPGILVLGNDSDFYALQGILGHRATLVPESRYLHPFSDQMSIFTGVIVADSYNAQGSDLLQRAEGKPVAVVDTALEPGAHGGLWSLTRPLDDRANEVVYGRLLQGEHPESIQQRSGSNRVTVGNPTASVVLDPEEYQEVVKVAYSPFEEIDREGLTAAAAGFREESVADPLGLVQLLLDSRMTGESSAEAIKRWVESETGLFGWVELNPQGEGPPLVQVGGREPGEVYRRLGDVFDLKTPIPAATGDYGPFIGMTVEDYWLGILPGESEYSRRSFWRVLELLPQMEEMIPRKHADGSPRIENPEDRFERLLHSRIRSAERHGTLPGVVLLEVPDSVKDPVARVRNEVRAADWCEVSGDRIWILLDQSEPGTAKGLSSRLLKVLPGVRGGGTIGACTGYVARQCMDRAIDLMRNNDTLKIEEEGS